MKKILLFTFSGLALTFSAKAQSVFSESPFLDGAKRKLISEKPTFEKSTAVESDLSYYYWENNSRHTAELNAHLGTTNANDGGFDTLGLYPYMIKQRATMGGYWQRAIQGIPNQGELTLLGITFVGSSLNAVSSNVVVNVYEKDLQTLLTTQTLQINTTYGYKSVTFDTPVTHNDTLLVVWQMATAADSFEIARTHSLWNNFDFGPSGVYTSDLPFAGDAALLAVSIGNNNNTLGLIADEFDFFVIPEFAYEIASDFTPSETEICLGDSISFVNTSSVFHQMNPILNFIQWDYLANNNAPVYTLYDYGNGNSTIYIEGQEHGVTYDAADTYTVNASTLILPWTSEALVTDAQNFTITVTDCSLGFDEMNSNLISIYPNPTTSLLNIKASEDLLYILNSNDGKIITNSSINANETLTIDLTGYSTGVYFLHISTFETLTTYKIIKE